MMSVKEQRMDIEKAKEYAALMHKGQTRRNGSDYIDHPVSVAEMLKDQGYDERYRIAGLFHDLLEDTKASEEEILELSDRDVLTAVKLLTKKKGEPKDTYISLIINNPIAKAVKNADRVHNLREAIEDVKNGAPDEFLAGYLKDSKKYFYGKFSGELDDLIDKFF